MDDIDSHLKLNGRDFRIILLLYLSKDPLIWISLKIFFYHLLCIK